MWFPLRTTGRTIAGRGVNSRLLSTIGLAHGVRQVTYADHALYTYTGGGKRPERQVDSPASGAAAQPSPRACARNMGEDGSSDSWSPSHRLH